MLGGIDDPEDRFLFDSNNINIDIDGGDDSRNFDDYEALINLDEDVVQSVPQKLIDLLPISKYTEGN